MSRDKNETEETIQIDGRAKRMGKPRSLRPDGGSFKITFPMKELVRQAILYGMDIAEFIASHELVFYDVTPKGGSWIKDGWTLVRFERKSEE